MRVFRWLMVLPVAAFALVLGSLAGGMAIGILGNQPLTDAGSAFFGNLACAFTAGLIAPSRRCKTTLAFAGVIGLLAILSFVLSVATNLEGFADRPAVNKILVPVAQILGALYATFLLPPIINPGTTLEALWREISALGAVVVLIGILITLLGLLVGMLGTTWVGFSTGLGVLAVGAATLLFPFIHLSLRVLRFKARISDELLHDDEKNGHSK